MNKYINGNKTENKEKIVLTLHPVKCEECDFEFCEFFLFCKGKNIDKNSL